MAHVPAHVPEDDLGRRSLISAAGLLVLAGIAFLVIAYGGHAPVFFGALLFGSGVIELIDAQVARGTRRERRAGLEGLIPCAAGLFLIFQLGIQMRALAIAVGVFFVINGAFRLLFSVIDRYPRWSWDAGYGVLAVVLGVYLLFNPAQVSSSLLAALIGIELILRAVAIGGRDMALRRSLRRPASNRAV